MENINLYVYKAKIASHYDGDSWRLDIDLGLGNWKINQRLRLYGIDTPEIRGEERPEGLISLNAVEEWCPVGTEVYLETYKDKSGKYGRWLGIVWPIGWDVSVNDRLISEGLAEIYPD